MADAERCPSPTGVMRPTQAAADASSPRSGPPNTVSHCDGHRQRASRLSTSSPRNEQLRTSAPSLLSFLCWCGGKSKEGGSMATMARGPGLYEFLIESELQHYYNGLKNDLKVNTVAQLKYVEDDDLCQIGMSKPEMRRLRKFFHKYYPQTYLRRIKQMILPRKEDGGRSSLFVSDNSQDKNPVKVPSKHIIPADSIFINKELGVGEFGVVQQGVWTNETGERIQVAIKKLSKERMQNNPMDFLKEAAIMHTIDHQNIVRLYGVVLDTNALMLVTELAPLRSLLECLKEPALRQSFPVISLCDFALQICDGMQYLESKRFIHRDLAARNILVFMKNKVKISDFGLSRALGVGKDYYQTNFNVNLKLPIAWCAPECINYLRFTSASDVWAYGVTLWEMYSYGFQPWAALTGQQILEAIDEPNFQRLEQPECCPKEYYSLMLKCWQHDPNKRPKFSEIMAMLPDCKPEQVQAIRDFQEVTSSPKPKRDQLQYKIGDVITVLDKKPLPDIPNIWKGVLNTKTGLFNPVHTVAYLGTNIPTMIKPSFSRGDSKSSLYSSRRRLRPDMISLPQGDLKHTGHVGVDGAYFGDIPYLGDKYQQLPKQIVTPYKPQEDRDQNSISLTRASSDVSDRAPLLKSIGGRNGSTSENWSDASSEKGDDKSHLKTALVDHEYHEISDEDDVMVESPRFERCLDLGPSLMDEVFKALGTKQEEAEEVSKDESNNVKNEIKEITSKAKDNGGKKKQATVKPISASDQKTLESAIAMANELATKSMLELDHRSESDTAQDSPRSPTSPTKRKFSFKLPTTRSSPKTERRNFAQEAASIPDIQESLTEEAKEAYNSLVDKGQMEPISPPPLPPQPPQKADEETNPLRMLRSGVPVRPKVRGNKHTGTSRSTSHDTVAHTTSFRHSESRTVESSLQSQSMENVRSPPPVSPKPVLQMSTLPRPSFQSSNPLAEQSEEVCTSLENGNGLSDELDGDKSSVNPLPLPPRDRSKPMQQHKPRQRKHPLVIPGNTRPLSKPPSIPDVSPVNGRPETLSPDSSGVSSDQLSPLLTPSSTSPSSSQRFDSATDLSPASYQNKIGAAPAKPPRAFNLDDSFDGQIQADIDSLDDIPEEEAPIPPVDHHVSCEDLLDFACDRPNAKRTQGRARGIDSDEVRIMQKVLAKEITPEECLIALNETDWDVHKAIKYTKLQTLLNSQLVSVANCKQTLQSCNWDVQKAYSYLLATYGVTEDSTEV